MHLSSAAQWWDEWQLRILVLGSLALQWFLVLAAPMRKYSIPLWLRRCIQLGSACSDAVAIYALATVFNRHANGTMAGCSNGEADVRKPPSMLEVLWAPVLLIHLGGVEEVSASNIDDNTLWIRQTVSLLSQVTIAIFGFYKSWPGSGSGAGDRRMLASAVLLFILGILSVLEKPLALRGARVDPLMAESKVMEGARVKPSAWWKRCFTELDDRYKCWKELPEGDAPILSHGDQVQMILSDLSLFAAEVTLHLQRRRGGGGGCETTTTLPPLDPTSKEDPLKPILRQAFELIYTRANVMLTPAYLACHVLLVPSLHIAAIMLFVMRQQQKKQGQGYNSGGTADIKTTYILLCLTAVLDVFGVLISKLCDSLMFKGNVPALCQKLGGYNLIDSVLSQTRTTTTTIGWLLRCVRRICYKEGYSGKEKDMSLSRPVSEAITTQLVRVFERVRNADLSSYRSFAKTDYWRKDQTERLLNTHYYSMFLDQRLNTAAILTDDQDQQRLKNQMDNTAASLTDDQDQQRLKYQMDNSTAKILTDDQDRQRLKNQMDNTASVSTDDQDQQKKMANIVGSWAKVDEQCPMKMSGTATVVSSPTAEDQKKRNVVIWRSLRKMPFDASVLIWHIATDLCFRSKPPRHFRCRPPHGEVLREVCTEAISNYMAYLLMFRPDMLMTGSRQHLFTEATKKMEHIITQATKEMREKAEKEQQQPPPLSNEILLYKIKEEAANLKQIEAYSAIDDACKLAVELLCIEDDDDRWHLMHRMWVGMLCYSASMCRGYLHAKSLGEGGEFLSYVWLLISLQGAKTLADKLQMPDKEPGDDYVSYLLDEDDGKPKQDLDKKGTTMPEWQRALSFEEEKIWVSGQPF